MATFFTNLEQAVSATPRRYAKFLTRISFTNSENYLGDGRVASNGNAARFG